jgi:hypothetical protein
MDMNSVLTYKLKEINYPSLKQNFEKCSIYDYRCMLANGELVLLLGCGVSKELSLILLLNVFVYLSVQMFFNVKLIILIIRAL